MDLKTSKYNINKMSKTIIFHCGYQYHIESSIDDKYINALKQDYVNKLGYIVCDASGTILEQYGDPYYIGQCIQMVSIIKQKYGTCTMYKAHSAYYNHDGSICQL